MLYDVVLIGGFPAAGKSTITNDYVEQGYTRLNRDTEGGTVADLLPKLDVLLTMKKPVVLDNLYATKATRAGAIALAKKHGVKIAFVQAGAELEDAQFNACLRMMQKVGRILSPEEKTNDPNLFPVAVLYKYRKEFEKPSVSEGFDNVSVIPFQRKYPKEWVNKAVILDADGTVRETTNGAKFPTDPSHVKVLPGRKEKLLSLQKEGYLILGVSNQSGIAKKDLTKEQAEACFKETNRQLGLDIPWAFCPHKVPPITCYCRKPGSGLGVKYIVEHNLDPRQCYFVGDLGTDKSFAGRCGFKFVDANEFFRK